ncbi:MAG: hypothetical protein DPW09_27460 [Anaerolineae bacterium]|nr:CSLREA domain-containing protein [Anaerolineales bacterium]MCQ3977183.1 hypothetical protein [Anaerolineae bacterium]
MLNLIQARPSARPRTMAGASLTIVVLLAVLILIAPPVQAATITVNTTTDENNNDGDCSLREAIIAANTDTAVDACLAGSGADTISLPAGNYLLTISGRNENAAQTGDLDLSADLTISGAGQTMTIIDAGTLDRVFHIGVSSTVEISGVTIAGGRITANFGGGVFVNNGSTLTLTDSQVIGNSAASGGGGIYVSDSALTLVNSRVSSNSTTSDGGGIYADVSTVILTGSLVDLNKATSGGGIYTGSGTLTLTNSQIVSNSASYSGGGIYDSASTLTLTNSRISGNQGGYSGGGINAGTGNLTLLNSQVDGNTVDGTGGGIYLSLGTATITNTLVSTNTSGFAGGGISSGSALTLVNSTISGNSSVNNGGGLDIRIGTTKLYNVTLANNTADSDSDNDGDGGGAYIFSPDGTLIATHSIIGGNIDGSTASNQHPDCSGALTGAGYNLIENIIGCTLAGDLTGNIAGLSPTLGPLQNNDGPTFTHALLVGSPAIDAGNPAGCSDPAGLPLTTDQRGFFRPADGDGNFISRCDLGAYEFNSSADPAPTSNPIYLPIIHR